MKEQTLQLLRKNKNKKMKQKNYRLIVLLLIVVLFIILCASVIIASPWNGQGTASTSVSSSASATDSSTILLYNGRSIPRTDREQFLTDGSECGKIEGACWTISGNRVLYKTKDGLPLDHTNPAFNGWKSEDTRKDYTPDYTRGANGVLYSIDGKVKLETGDYDGLSKGFLDASYQDSAGVWHKVGTKFDPSKVQSFSLTGSGDNAMPVVHGTEHTYIYDLDSTGDLLDKIQLTNEEYEAYMAPGKSIASVSTSSDGTTRKITFGAEGSYISQDTVFTKSGSSTSVTITTKNGGAVTSSRKDTRYPGNIVVGTVTSGDTTDHVLQFGSGDDEQTIAVESIVGDTGKLKDGRPFTINIYEGGKKYVIEGDELTTIDIVGTDKKLGQTYIASIDGTRNEMIDRNKDGEPTASHGRMGKVTFESTTTKSGDQLSTGTTFYGQRGEPVAVIPPREVDSDSTLDADTGTVLATVYDSDGEAHFVQATKEQLSLGQYEQLVGGDKEVSEDYLKGLVSSGCSGDIVCEKSIATYQESKKYGRGETRLEVASAVFTSLGQVGRTQGLSSLLFAKTPLYEWASSVDKWFSRNVMNEEALASAACYALTLNQTDQQEEGVSFIENSYGSIQPIAHIFGEVSKTTSLLCDVDEEGEETCPNDLECLDDGFCHAANGDHVEGFFYKVSWAVAAPSDEAATPDINEDGTVLNYNVWIEPDGFDNINFYESPASRNCPLRLVNGANDGGVVTWWSNNDYTGADVCIRWDEQCHTSILTTGGSALGIDAAEGNEIDEPCNTIKESTKNIAEIGSANSVVGNDNGDTVSVTTGDEDTTISLNSDLQ
jgi:hypothetical protein